MSVVSWIFFTATRSCGGTTIHPILQLAKPYDFESEKSEIVCAALSGIEAGLKCCAPS